MEQNILGKSRIGKNCVIQENVIIGAPSKDLINVEKIKLPGAVIGNDCIIRSGSIIYSKVRIGENFKTGHNILVRENTTLGDNVLIGTNSIVENDCIVGNNVAYSPTSTSQRTQTLAIIYS